MGNNAFCNKTLFVRPEQQQLNERGESLSRYVRVSFSVARNVFFVVPAIIELLAEAPGSLYCSIFGETLNPSVGRSVGRSVSLNEMPVSRFACEFSQKRKEDVPSPFAFLRTRSVRNKLNAFSDVKRSTG